MLANDQADADRGPDPPLFTIVVPTHGRPLLLAEALSSIADQTVSDFECLVVDDASPEPVVVPEDPRFRLVRRETNGGQAATLNTGLSEARGRYVAFLDDDDAYTPDRLALALKGLEREAVSICLSATTSDPLALRTGNPAPASFRMLRGDVSASIREGMTPNLGRVAVRADRMIGFDERLRASADVDWWIRLARESRVWTVPRVGLLYRVHAAARHGNAASARVEALQAILEKHAGYFNRHRRAKAFHLYRIGRNALNAGLPRAARAALAHSLRLRPASRTARYWWRARRLSLARPDSTHS